jgi:multisubunit Na+/H+ antiporter MnhB subunit
MTTETKQKKRRSYFGPILLIAIGLVFLAHNLGFIPGEGWETILKLWPVLLIVAGMDDLFRREGIAWPILLIGAGTFLLLNNFGPQSWISWTQIFQLWPILLIAFGIDLMFKGQTGWATAAGIVLTVALIGGAILITSTGYKISADYVDLRESYDLSVEDTEIDVSLSLGQLILSAESNQGVLIAGSITPSTKEENLEETQDRISYRLENNTPAFYPHTARWELGITNELNLDLIVDNGMGEMFLDLEELNLVSLDVNQGVGRLVIRLPKTAAEDVLINQAIGTIHIQIPDNVMVTVDAQNGLSRVNFPADFELRNGLYSSPGANRTNSELYITVEQAIGYISFQYAR